MVLLAVNFENLHQILQSLYEDMMPLCSQMTGVAKGLAGLGALFYVAYRVWQSLARAEPIDVFPLLRPFALGLCIMFFPTLVLGTGIKLRLRGCASKSRYIWKRPGHKNIRLKAVADGSDVIVTLPAMDGWKIGYISISHH